MNEPSPNLLAETKGLSVVEVLVALLISSAMFLMSFPSLKMLFEIKKGIFQKEELVIKEQTIREAYKQGISQSQMFSAVQSLRIHPPGRVVDLLGNLVNVGKGKNAPHPLSTPASFLVLAPLSLFEVKPGQSNSWLNNGAMLICALNNDAYESLGRSGNELRYWLGVSVDGVVELRGTIKKTLKLSKECEGQEAFEGNLSSVKSPLFTKPGASNANNNNRVPSNLNLLIGVKEAYTLYVDAENRLRRFSHSGKENQPILENVEKIVLTEEVSSLINLVAHLKNKNNKAGASLGSSSTSFSANFFHGAYEAHHYLEIML